MHVMIEFGRKIYQECLKEIEENIRQSEFRENEANEKKNLCNGEKSYEYSEGVSG